MLAEQTITAQAAASPTRLRDMNEEAFADRYDCDRFTATIILNRLSYAVEHMSTGFLRQAFSPIIKDWYDFACTVSGPPELGYPMSVISNSLMTFLGSMADAVRNAVEEYGPENLKEGDVLICNDPYRAGNHVNDVCFIRPVFADGRIVSFVNLRAHQLDIGGSVPGGFSAAKITTYENGLVIPPMLLFSDDKPIRSTFSLIFDNARYGNMLLPDFKSIFQQLKLGEKLLGEAVERYGKPAYLGTLTYACDLSAEKMADAIARIPDGAYEGSAIVDADAIADDLTYKINVRLTKRGALIECDLSGSSAQARTAINSGILDAKTAIGVSLTLLLDPTVPFTSGTWRNIDIAAPAGTILTSLPPDGPTMMFWESSGAIITAIFNALNPVLGGDGVGGDYGSSNNHNAFGRTPDGQPWTNAGLCGGEHGPWGATKAGDADSYTVLYLLNNLDPATESIEQDTPVVMMRKEHAIDTGGAGTYRGGAANLKDTLWLSDVEHHCGSFRTKQPTGVGANGGAAGPNGAVWIFDPPEDGALPQSLKGLDEDSLAQSRPIVGVLDAETKMLSPEKGVYFHYGREKSWKTAPGAITRYITNGGGGWGNAFARDVDKVLADVRNEYVSIEGAARDYGVVVLGDPQRDPEGLTIDKEATSRLRAN